MTASRTHMQVFIVIALGAAALLTGCGSVEKEAKYPTGADRSANENDIYSEQDSVFGKGGLSLFGRKKDEDELAAGSGIAVNSFLWRAALDTVSFMPLASADPFGGVILTDWYSPADNGLEQYKLNVFILGRQLRSDGIRVRVFKQELSRGTWRDVEAPRDMALELEEAILTRARQLRVGQLQAAR